MTFDFDLFVIGGGSGGVRAARVAAGEAGAKVGLAEDDRLGGTCVIRGCVPKKLMVFASGYRAQIEDAREYGWDIPGGETFRWPNLMRGTLPDYKGVRFVHIDAAFQNRRGPGKVTLGQILVEEGVVTGETLVKKEDTNLNTIFSKVLEVMCDTDSPFHERIVSSPRDRSYEVPGWLGWTWGRVNTHARFSLSVRGLSHLVRIKTYEQAQKWLQRHSTSDIKRLMRGTLPDYPGIKFKQLDNALKNTKPPGKTSIQDILGDRNTIKEFASLEL